MGNIVVRSLSCVWTAACHASLSFTISQGLLKLMSIESVMPSNLLILCLSLLFLPPIFPSIRIFSNESALHIRWPKYWSFSFSISPSNEYSCLENPMNSMKRLWCFQRKQPYSIFPALCSQECISFQGLFPPLLHLDSWYPPGMKSSSWLHGVPRMGTQISPASITGGKIFLRVIWEKNASFLSSLTFLPLWGKNCQTNKQTKNPKNFIRKAVPDRWGCWVFFFFSFFYLSNPLTSL